MGNVCHQMTDKELAQAAARSGLGAFDEIVQRYCQQLTTFALAKTANMEDAEDIVQETFLRAYQNIKSFDSKYALKNWLFTIAYRLIVSGYRKKRPQRLSDQAAAQLAVDQPDPQENQWIWEAAGKMGVDAFTALWLRYNQDMTISEIANVMKKTEITVRVLLHRSRKRLAKQIADLPEIAEQSRWTHSRNVSLERAK